MRDKRGEQSNHVSRITLSMLDRPQTIRDISKTNRLDLHPRGIWYSAFCPAGAGLRRASPEPFFLTNWYVMKAIVFTDFK